MSTDGVPAHVSSGSSKCPSLWVTNNEINFTHSSKVGKGVECEVQFATFQRWVAEVRVHCTVSVKNISQKKLFQGNRQCRDLKIYHMKKSQNLRHYAICSNLSVDLLQQGLSQPCNGQDCVQLPTIVLQLSDQYNAAHVQAGMRCHQVSFHLLQPTRRSVSAF